MEALAPQDWLSVFENSEKTLMPPSCRTFVSQIQKSLVFGAFCRFLKDLFHILAVAFEGQISIEDLSKIGKELLIKILAGPGLQVTRLFLPMLAR